MDKDIFTVLFAAVSAFIGIYNWRASTRRGKLKDDLEILKKYREEMLTRSALAQLDDVPAAHLRDKILRRMHRVYVVRGAHWPGLIAGIGFVLAAGTPVLLVFLGRATRPLEGWLLTLVTVSAVAGLALIVGAIQDSNDAKPLPAAGTDDLPVTQVPGEARRDA